MSAAGADIHKRPGIGILRGLAALTVALVVLTSCGGNGDDRDRTQTLSVSSPAPATAATPAAAPSPVADAAAELHRDDFERAPTAGPFIRHSVARFPAGMAQALLDRWRQAFERCPEWEEAGSQGGSYQIRAAPLALPRLGDQTLAIRYTISGGGTAAQADQIVIRRGNVLSGLTATTVGLGAAQPFDAMLLEQLARKADEKLQVTRGR